MLTPRDTTALTIVVPAYNEEEGIEPTLRDLRQAFPVAEILLIDDGCADRTAARAASVPDVRVLRHDTNRGYGASIKTGIKHASHETVAWYDADGQHTPDSLAILIKRFHENALHAAI